MKEIKNQFILYKTTNQISVPEGWKEEQTGEFKLLIAPELPVYQSENGDVRYIMLGLAFHIQDSSMDEMDILKHLPSEFDAYLNAVDFLCGNFIIIRKTKEAISMINDAGSAMKIFYHIDANGNIDSAASDPAFLRVFVPLHINENPDAKAFYKSSFFVKNKIRLGNKTKYSDVYQVLPNHLLNLTESKTERFFPRDNNENLTLQESVSKLNFYLNNVIDAASRKYNLRCALTAGWDSRMVLAATKKHKANTTYYTFHREGKKNQKLDMKLARLMADKLDLNHITYKVTNNINNEYLSNIQNNYDQIPRNKAEVIGNVFSKFDDRNDLALLGLISEIAKNYYEAVIVKDGITLTKAAHFKECSYVVNHQQNKFEELKPLCDKYGYDLRDIAHWEQDITNFAGQSMQYHSYMMRSFSPFNSREIIKTILGTSRKMRDKHRHKYYRYYLKKYWPELLSFPLNPSFKKKMIVFGKKTGFYTVYKIFTNNFMK